MKPTNLALLAVCALISVESRAGETGKYLGTISLKKAAAASIQVTAEQACLLRCDGSDDVVRIRVTFDLAQIPYSDVQGCLEYVLSAPGRVGETRRCGEDDYVSPEDLLGEGIGLIATRMGGSTCATATTGTCNLALDLPVGTGVGQVPDGNYTLHVRAANGAANVDKPFDVRSNLRIAGSSSSSSSSSSSGTTSVPGEPVSSSSSSSGASSAASSSSSGTTSVPGEFVSTSSSSSSSSSGTTSVPGEPVRPVNPSISFTANGGTNIEVRSGDMLNYVWSVRNTTGIISVVESIDGLSSSVDPCGYRAGQPWVANTGNTSGGVGRSSASVASCQVGHTYVLTITATGDPGTTPAVARVTITVIGKVDLSNNCGPNWPAMQDLACTPDGVQWGTICGCEPPGADPTLAPGTGNMYWFTLGGGCYKHMTGDRCKPRFEDQTVAP